MGICSSFKTSEKEIHASIQIAKYPRLVSLNIKWNRKGQLKRSQKTNFEVTQPMIVSYRKIEQNGLRYSISLCVLPGLDPNYVYKKPCQDYCFMQEDQESILVGLYDGHGQYGQQVVQYCTNQALNFYQQRKRQFLNNKVQFLNELTLESDKELKSNHCSIDVTGSGSTMVMILIEPSRLYCASVGDSRAVIGTSNLPNAVPAQPQGLDPSSRAELEEVRRRRTLTSSLKSIQLTKDQKPEDPEEMQRIIKAGGRVKRMCDNNGNPIGPYRVWKKFGKAPGLAMSRSIGDSVGKQVGIIATPVCTEWKIGSHEEFLVIASDGVWDVMENQDVVDFVDHYRKQCLRENQSCTTDKYVTPDNSCIAQLLCEEARYRWYTIVENEGVIIDDISCIIVEFEFNCAGKKGLKKKQSNQPRNQQDDYVLFNGSQRLDNFDDDLVDIDIRDARRGSIPEDNADFMQEASQQDDYILQFDEQDDNLLIDDVNIRDVRRASLPEDCLLED